MIKLKVCLLKPRLAGDFSKPLLASSVRVIAFIFPLRHEKDKVDFVEILKNQAVYFAVLRIVRL